MTATIAMTKEAAFVPVRAALGATMLYHGAQKVRGPGQAAGMFESLGFKPGERWARLTGLAEVFGGATAILGIGTRLGALAVLATQAVAIGKVHGPKGFSNLSGGYEFNLALIGMAAALLAAGPGVISAHELLERRVARPVWALARPRRRIALRFVKLLK